MVGTAAAADLGLLRGVQLELLQQVEYTYLLFPFVVWAAVRFGPRGASLVTLVVAAVAVWHTARGGGPFLVGSTGGTLFAVACYLLVLAVTGLWWSVAPSGPSGTARPTRCSGARSACAWRSTAARMGIWYWSVETNALVWDDNLRALYGLRPGRRGRRATSTSSRRVHPDDRAVRLAVGGARTLESGDALDYEFRILLPDGRVRWIADQGKVGRDAEGRPRYLTGVCMDVTERRGRRGAAAAVAPHGIGRPPGRAASPTRPTTR